MVGIHPIRISYGIRTENFKSYTVRSLIPQNSRSTESLPGGMNHIYLHGIYAKLKRQPLVKGVLISQGSIVETSDTRYKP